MYLLRLSYGIVRANHFMRTTPLPQWDEVAAKFDACVREPVVKIIGTTFPDDSYVQAWHPPCRGACPRSLFGELARVYDHLWREVDRPPFMFHTAPAPKCCLSCC